MTPASTDPSLLLAGLFQAPGGPPVSWPLFALLVVVLALVTIGAVVWAALAPEKPSEEDDRAAADAVDRLVAADRSRAEQVRRELEADSGRSDPTGTGRG